MAFSNSFSVRMIRIPFPPPPPAALMRIGYPIFSAVSPASLIDVIGSVVPGTTGDPVSRTNFLAAILSPIVMIALVDGPIQTVPVFCTDFANSQFSERNPYPG